MKLVSKLIGDRKRPAIDAAAVSAADHIARALAAAGLGPQGPGASIRATIDSALAKAGLTPGADAGQVRAPAPTTPPARGRFLHASYASAHGSRDYRLYVPVDVADGAPRPLVLMLHGCTQSAEDFAVGTRMNLLADEHGFLVAYPQQAGSANASKCWNWFRPEDQGADGGEPAILTGLIQHVAESHPVDLGRVFVAGLSAGAAMAVILGRTHPQLVRAIGVHSGLPYASAHDVGSAFAAMQGRGAAKSSPAAGSAPGVPMIVFHGDQDHTVAHGNADTLIAQADRPGLSSLEESGSAPGGQAYTRRIDIDAAGRPWLESWTVHGAGHAWSGGDRAGSYTDPAGPDASAAMVDFFLRQG